MATKKPPRQESWRGMNWIRQEKRLAIYLRDGMACVYCGSGVEDVVRLTLDHFRPHSKGGTNEAGNLVTCCNRCNASRGDRPVATFVRAVARYLNDGATDGDILAHIARCRKRALPMAEAKELLARRREQK